MPCRQAAITPSGTAISTVMTIVRGRERQRRSDPLPDQLGDLGLEEERLAEIALQQVADPDHELLVDRLGQAEALADLGDLLRRWRCRRR